jgi:hypothetical protein
MTAWVNAEIHIYLDRDCRWRSRVEVTHRGTSLRFDVPPRDRPGTEHAHGLVPLFMQIVEAFAELRDRGASQ